MLLCQRFHASYRYHAILSGFKMRIFSGGRHLLYEDNDHATLPKFKKEKEENKNILMIY
jgi:hypothetical protein